MLFNFDSMQQSWGRLIIYAGMVIVLIGVIIYFFHDKLHWLGRLPGDIRIERDNFRFYFPITTMVLISLLLTLIINVVRRFL